MKSRSRTTSSHWSSGVSRPTSPSVRAPKAPSAVVVTTPLAPAQVAIQGGWTPSGLAVNVARRHSRSVPSSHESELLVTEGRLSAKTSRSTDCRFLGLPSLPESNVSLEVGGGISTLSRKSVEKVSVTSVGSAGGSLLWAKSPFVEIMPIVQSSKSVTLKRSGVALSSSTSKVKATAFESQSRLSTYRAETPSRHRSTKGSLTSISNQRDLATAMADIARRLFDRKSQETGIFAEYERTAKSLYASPATSHSSLLRRSRRSLELTTRPLAHDLQEVSSRSSQKTLANSSRQHIAEVTITPIEITPIVQPETRPHGSRHLLRSPYDNAAQDRLLAEHFERHALARALSPGLWSSPKNATTVLSRPSSPKQMAASAKTSKTALSKSQERLGMRSFGTRKPSQGAFTKGVLSKPPSDVSSLLTDIRGSRDVTGSSISAKAPFAQGFGQTADKKTFFDAQDSLKTAADVSPPTSRSSISIQGLQKPLIQYPSSIVETQGAFTKAVLLKPPPEVSSLLTERHGFRDVTGSSRSSKTSLVQGFGPTADQKTFFDVQESVKTASDISLRAPKSPISIQAPQKPLVQYPASVVETQGAFTKTVLSKPSSEVSPLLTDIQGYKGVTSPSKSTKAPMVQGFGPTADQKTFFDAQDSIKTASDISLRASKSPISIQAPQKPLIPYPCSVVETQKAVSVKKSGEKGFTGSPQGALSVPATTTVHAGLGTTKQPGSPASPPVSKSLLTEASALQTLVEGASAGLKKLSLTSPGSPRGTAVEVTGTSPRKMMEASSSSPAEGFLQPKQASTIAQKESAQVSESLLRKGSSGVRPGSPSGATSLFGGTTSPGHSPEPRSPRPTAGFLEPTKSPRSPQASTQFAEPWSPRPTSGFLEPTKSPRSPQVATQFAEPWSPRPTSGFLEPTKSPRSPQASTQFAEPWSPRPTSGFLEPTKSPRSPQAPAQVSILEVPVQQAVVQSAATVAKTGQTVGPTKSATTFPSYPQTTSSVLAETSSSRQLTESWSPRATSGILDPTKSPRGVPLAPSPSSKSITEPAPKLVQPTGGPLVPIKSAALSSQATDSFPKHGSTGQLVQPSSQLVAATTEKDISGPFPGLSAAPADASTSISTLKTVPDIPVPMASQPTSLVSAKDERSAALVGTKTSLTSVGQFARGRPATVFAPTPSETPMLPATDKSASQSSIGSPSLALSALGPGSPTKKSSDLASPGEIRRLLEAKGSPTPFAPKQGASLVDIPSPPQLPADSASPLSEELTSTGDKIAVAPDSQRRVISTFKTLSPPVTQGPLAEARGSEPKIAPGALVPLETSVSELKPSSKRSSSLVLSAAADDKWTGKVLRAGSGPGELDIAGSQSALVEIRADSSATKIAGESRRVSGMELRKRSETMMKLSSTSLAKTAVPSGSSDLLAASTKSSEERISRDLIIDAREQEAGGALEATEAVGARQATARQSATSLGGDQKVTAVQEWPSAEQIIDAKERWSITTDRSADAAVAAKVSTSDLAVASRRISSAEEGKSSSYMTSPQETSPTSPTKKGKKVRKVLKRGSAPSADDENRSISEQIAQALSEADYGDMPLQVNMTIDLVPPKSASATSTSRGVLSPVHIEKKMIVESCKDGHVEVKVPPVFIDSPDGKHVSSEALNVSVSVDIGKHAKEGHKCDLENEASKATGSEAKP
ncbi:uncharacterized protein LOC144124908 [Amblyomma americanum]